MLIQGQLPTEAKHKKKYNNTVIDKIKNSDKQETAQDLEV